MKISVITVVFNGEAFLEDCIQSVINQTYTDVEYIVIDGASTDNSIHIIGKYQQHIHKFISEADNGLYDAINKGIELSTGAVVGLLNADDMLADDGVIAKVAQVFRSNQAVEAVYGDLNYVHPQSLKIIRKWKSKPATFKDLERGWMPAHPTLYIKKNTFEKFGKYALDMGTAADYDLMLRFLYQHKIAMTYMPVLMVNMRMGGVSNRSLNAILLAIKHDFKAMKRNKLPYPWLALVFKKLVKLNQFF